MVSGVESIISDSEVDTCLLHQYEEQLSGIKTELTSVSDDILALDCDEGALSEQDTKLNQAVFDVRLKIKRLLQGKVKPAPCSAEGGVKLPRLDIPTFNGNIVNCRSFWEQLSVSVHDRRKSSDSEKLTYLRHALRMAPPNTWFKVFRVLAYTTRKPLIVCKNATTDHASFIRHTFGQSSIHQHSKKAMGRNCVASTMLSISISAP